MTNVEEPASTWLKVFWAELDAMTPEQQFVATGELITYLTGTLLPELGIRRRDCIMRLVDRPSASPASVAAELGMRPTTVTRLLEEAKSHAKHVRLGEQQAA